jgi:hypothetical protein
MTGADLIDFIMHHGLEGYTVALATNQTDIQWASDAQQMAIFPSINVVMLTDVMPEKLSVRPHSDSAEGNQGNE